MTFPRVGNRRVLIAVCAAACLGSAAARAESPDSPLTVSPSPVKTRGWDGPFPNSITPADAVGAVGPTRYVQIGNAGIIISYRGGGVVATGTLHTLWNLPGDASPQTPQIMWDATTKRFYYAGTVVYNDSSSALVFGFSTTSAPPDLSATSWCKYTHEIPDAVPGTGTTYPEFPRLGDSRNFIIIGYNKEVTGTYTGSDILAISKPPAGATCPAIGSFLMATGADIKVAGADFFGPAPANEIDGNATGWVVARPRALPATAIGLFKVTKNLDGTPNIQTAGTSVTVASYGTADPAPQSGTTLLFDTGDPSFTQAVGAIDPDRGNALRIWTQHTTSGGAGAEIRWYEISPGAASMVQSGKVTSESLYIFNGAISPDRVVNGPTQAFGSAMVLGFNTSSSTTFLKDRMVSKRYGFSQSALVTVKSSPGPMIWFCNPAPATCYYGRYASAGPDPAASVANPTGEVFFTNQWTEDGNSMGGLTWRLYNWAAQP